MSIHYNPAHNSEQIALQMSHVSYKTNSTCSSTESLRHVSYFSLCLLKLRSRAFWVVIMVLMGSIYTLTNMINMYKLLSPELDYELVIGPPPKLILYLLAAFTVMNMILYVLETINTISVFCREGNTILSITIEMVVTISLVHIPISSLNFFLAKCRAMQISLWQVLSGVFSIIYVFMRILWFAHMQGKKIKINDKRDIKQGVFLAVCALFSCALAFQIMSWKDASLSERLESSHTKNVTIMLLDIPNRRVNRIQRLNLTDRVLNPDFHSKTLQDITTANESGLIAVYLCHHDTNHSLPLECLHNNTYALKFRFVYQLEGAEPFGEILFNYAKLYKVHSDSNDSYRQNKKQSESLGGNKKSEIELVIDNKNNSSSIHSDKFSYNTVNHQDNTITGCEQSKRTLDGSWNLWYLTLTAEIHYGVKNIFGQSPWNASCTVPHPKYVPDLSVC